VQLPAIGTIHCTDYGMAIGKLLLKLLLLQGSHHIVPKRAFRRASRGLLISVLMNRDRSLFEASKLQKIRYTQDF
jgi:hypothetical protein